MPTYEKANDAMVELLEQTKRAHHQRLGDVTIGMLVALAPINEDTGEPKGPALKLRGVACLAVTRVVGLKLRTHGLEDAEIVIDGDRWPELSQGERVALLDHELTHLELNCDKHGANRRDDLGRPKLKMRPHDHEFGWFDEVAERHGINSIEVRQARQFQEDWGQLYFDFEQDELALEEDPTH